MPCGASGGAGRVGGGEAGGAAVWGRAGGGWLGLGLYLWQV